MLNPFIVIAETRHGSNFVEELSKLPYVHIEMEIKIEKNSNSHQKRCGETQFTFPAGPSDLILYSFAALFRSAARHKDATVRSANNFRASDKEADTR